MIKALILILSLVVPFLCLGQEKNSESRVLEVSGYLELYYGFDFNQPSQPKRLLFLYNHTRHNSPAVNLGMISGSYQQDRFRANLTLQQGTYAQDNYANEPAVFRWIYEANLGIALDQNQKVWLDAGVMPSHIGFESAISIDNLTLSRSIIAENSPYFETGVKLGWEKSESWYFAFLYLNGWQRIQAIAGKNNPSFGTQATFRPNSKITLNWSTFLGTDQPLEAGTSLYFSNMYGNFTLGERWKVIAGVDVGKRTQVNSTDRNWWGLALITQYCFSERFAAALRYEYYHDPFLAKAYSGNNLGVETGGLSLNLDRKFGTWSVFRLEGRWLKSPTPFEQDIFPTLSENFFLLASWAFLWN